MCSNIFPTNVFLSDDIVVFDRNFHDSVDTMKRLDLNVVSSTFLNECHQFTVDEDNESRCVTKIRRIIETVNSRPNQFKTLSNTAQNSSIPHLEDYLSLVCFVMELRLT